MSEALLPFPISNAVMISVGCILIYLAIKKGYEPLLLLPIGFGAILVNIPYSGLMQEGGILWALYHYGVLTDIFPILIFIGIGAMIDFGALLERPWFLIFAAAGQLGIFIALLCALAVGFSPLEASSIGIIGAMDGPTAIFVTSKFAANLLPAVSVCAYSYMALVPILQIPISKALTTRKERLVRMEYKPAAYSKTVRIIFPIVVTIITGIVAPLGVPLMGSLMLGNLLKESGVVSRLAKSAENEIANITTLLLGIVIGATMNAESFLVLDTVKVFALGLVAFVSAIASGILFAKLVSFVTKGKVNPLIGACGISAFPMAARTAHKIGREEDSNNWLLPHAMATNVGGQIGSVVAGGQSLSRRLSNGFNRRFYMRILLFVALVSCLLIALGFGLDLAIAQGRTVGVSEGDWFKYTIAVDWISNDPNATMPASLKQFDDTEWFLLTIMDVSGTNITYQSVAHCENGTEFAGVTSVDIETGRDVAGTAIAANLNVNDVIYNKSFDHFPYSGLKINDTMTRTYPDGKERETNHAYFTMDNWNRTVNPDELEYDLHHFAEMYWDRSTGIMVETIGNITRSKTDGYFDNALVTFTIIESNVWTISQLLPEFPAWMSVVFVLVAFASAATFYRRKQPKTPKC